MSASYSTNNPPRTAALHRRSLHGSKRNFCRNCCARSSRIAVRRRRFSPPCDIGATRRSRISGCEQAQVRFGSEPGWLPALARGATHGALARVPVRPTEGRRPQPRSRSLVQKGREAISMVRGTQGSSCQQDARPPQSLPARSPDGF